MNDPTAQMGFQVGQHAVKAGTEYMEQNVRRSTFLFLYRIILSPVYSIISFCQR